MSSQYELTNADAYSETFLADALRRLILTKPQWLSEVGRVAAGVFSVHHLLTLPRSGEGRAPTLLEMAEMVVFPDMEMIDGEEAIQREAMDDGSLSDLADHWRLGLSPEGVTEWQKRFPKAAAEADQKLEELAGGEEIDEALRATRRALMKH